MVRKGIGRHRYPPLLVAGLFVIQAIIAAAAFAVPTTVLDPAYTAPIIDGAAQFRSIAYTRPLPNPLTPAYIYTPGSGEVGALVPDEALEPGVDWYELSLREIVHNNAGLVDDGVIGPVKPLLPGFKVRAYGMAFPNVPPFLNTYPGHTIEAVQGRPVKIEWYNELPPTHFLPVDKTIMCGPPPALGAPAMPCPEDSATVHVHGSHGYDHSDGLPEQWFTPFGPNGQPRQAGTLWNQNLFLSPPGLTTASRATLTMYPVDQEAATLWYHDHATGITRLNAMAGLAGFFLVHDANELAMQNANQLPKYPYEVPIAIQDHTFWGATVPGTQAVLGQMAMPDAPLQTCNAAVPPVCTNVLINGLPTPSIIPEFFGNIPLVNGVAWPKMDAEPRQYRLRLLNACDSRTLILRLALPGVTGVSPPTPSGDLITIIGNEQGFLNSPISVPELVIMPGMRYDVVIDLRPYAAAPQTLILQNIGPDLPYNSTLPLQPYPLPAAPVPPAPAPYIWADPDSIGQLMAINVILPLSAVPEATLPALLRPAANLYPPIPVVPPGTPVSKSFLKEVVDPYGRLQLTIDFKGLFDPITELPALGSTQVWEIANLTPDSHPMHLHLVKFRIVNREPIAGFAPAIPGPLPQPKPVYAGTGITTLARVQEEGFLDTVECPPGELTRVIATFDIPGVYVWHCHILHHEEYDMMREFAVTTPAKTVTLTSSLPGNTLVAPAPNAIPPAITFTAEAQTGLTGTLPGTGVTAPVTTLAYEYQFSMKDPAAPVWQIAQPWSKSNTFATGGLNGQFAIDAPGFWFVKVESRQIGSLVLQAANVLGIAATGNIPVGLTLLGPAVPNQTSGTPVPVTFTANGLSAPNTAGVGPYEFRFSLKDPAGVVTVVQPYLNPATGQPNPNTWTWTPLATQVPGTYTIQADIRTLGTQVNSLFSKSLTYSIQGGVPVGAMLTAPLVLQQPALTALPVLFTAAGLSAPATPGLGPYEYQFWSKVAGVWKVAQKWSANPSWTWTPPVGAAVGRYTFQVEVRAVGSKTRNAVLAINYNLI
jgi:spore coat protein A, manganese oxidase